jgi:lysophospholipase L1-like esterase
VVGNEDLASPGAPQVFGEAADRWIVYDAYEPGACTTGVCTGDRRMHVDKLCLDDDDDGAGVGPGAGLRTTAPSGGSQALARQATCRRDIEDGWVATWAVGIMPASSAQFEGLARGFADQTLRQVVHTSAGGEAARVRLSNAFGTRPLHVGRATVGIAAEPAGDTAAVDPASLRPLTFGGSAAMVVPPGGEVVSDAVPLDVPPDHDLAVSVWFPEPTGPPSGHLLALETSTVGPGDLVDDPGPGFTGTGTVTTQAAFFVGAVEVLVDEPRGTVVLLGDSLTDGAGVAPDAEERWSDHLVDRLVADGPAGFGLVNLGIAGNPLLPDARSTSPSGLERFDHDVLAQPDVIAVVVLLGTNDLLGHDGVGAALVDGLQRLVARAHAAGVRIVGVTIPPLAGPDDAAQPAAVERARTDVNARIRGDTVADDLGFDAVVDMDGALRDPADPTRVLAEYAWFGGLHPNAVGHAAMAEAIDLEHLVDAPVAG